MMGRTKFFSEKNRFSTVDILEITSGVLPENWAEVHSDNGEQSPTSHYPFDVFGLAETFEEGEYEGEGVKIHFSQDAYTYSSGWNPENPDGCRGGQPEFLYFGVRCAHPLGGRERCCEGGREVGRDDGRDDDDVGVWRIGRCGSRNEAGGGVEST